MNSVQNFNVFMPTRILFGEGRASEIGAEAAACGSRAVLVTYEDIRGLEETIESITGYLEEAGLSVTKYAEVEPDPSVETIDSGAAVTRDSGAEMMVAVGGGSAIDAAKAIAAVAVNGGSAWDYAACNPDKRTFDSSLPILAIPTTAGTGSEVTPVAVLTNKQMKSKGAVISPANIPSVAIVDPGLMKSMPPGLTAATGADAFGHALEAFMSTKCTPFVERMAPEAIKLAWENLPLACKDGSNMLARANMAWASTIAGIMLVQSGATGNHALAQALGAHLHVPHGLGVAIGTPIFLEYCRAEASGKYVQLAGELGIAQDTDDENKIADEFIKQVKDFLIGVGIPEDLRDKAGDIDMDALVENAMINAPAAIVNTPREVAYKDMEEIISKIL
ncbi:iron-containing alcohol dehydrogenase family protein [Candidatus Poribacteria bacterium]